MFTLGKKLVRRSGNNRCFEMVFFRSEYRKGMRRGLSTEQFTAFQLQIKMTKNGKTMTKMKTMTFIG